MAELSLTMVVAQSTWKPEDIADDHSGYWTPQQPPNCIKPPSEEEA
jgi:hypothetical protein